METESQTKNTRPDYDSGWKEIIEAYLSQALKWCFPTWHELIDWEKEWVFLEQELRAITRDGETGTRIVDKLIRVHFKDGELKWLLIHFEIETSPDTKEFPKRVFTYNVRIYDKFSHPVISCIVLADSSPNFRPNYFGYGEEGYPSMTGIHFTPCKLIDFETRRVELEQSKDVFAIVILCYLNALAAKKQGGEERLNLKIKLFRELYEKGFSKQDIRHLIRFLDFCFALPKDLELRYKKIAHQIEEEKHMAYLSTFERDAKNEGIQEGRQEGRQEGHQEAAHEIAIRMLERNIVSSEEIAQLTGLSLEEIHKLELEHKHLH